ncbi:transcription factor bHLH93-like [Cynara cardunculus var. scolymus]|nr:transcription factor bHLH93-like [Cynara cardunculus var. scolymus]
MNDIDHFDQNTLSITSQTSSSFEDFSSSLPFIFDQQTLNCSSFGQQHFLNPFIDHDKLLFSPYDNTTTVTAGNIKLESSPLFDQDDYSVLSSLLDDVQNCHFVHDHVGNRVIPDPKVHEVEEERRYGSGSGSVSGFNMGKSGKASKVEGQPSKNLMAERRRRKRLNDRLSMLRSVVPKISKMDRTSILGDTIDYMKELIEKINQMQEEMDISSNQLNLMNAKPKEIFIRNSPKFDVERRNTDTHVQVCCTSKPELLISTMTTLEALGLEIHQCVISCFNDFMMHASCSEEMEQRVILNSEDIKQALFRNAGYGGKCL